MTLYVRFPSNGMVRTGLIPMGLGLLPLKLGSHAFRTNRPMTSNADVLIISTAVDAATDDVVRILHERGVEVIRLNSEDLPFESTLTVDYQCLPGAALNYDGKQVAAKCVWYRRVRTPAKPVEMDSGVYDFCLRETRAALLGGVMTQGVRWMNHPAAVWQAEFKPYQLRVAREAGMKIPKTLVSNDPGAIAQAKQQFDRMIVKPARSGHFWQGGEEYAIYTSEVTADHFDSLSDARWAPSIYQELVPKEVDVRVTFVGGKIFSAAIHSQSDPAAAVDWRKTQNPDLPHSRIDLPQTLLDKIDCLMERLNLQFGCIDFVKTPEGEYVFLEVNPSGQWLWLDDQLGLGISSAIADWLATT